jgi:TonB family protein
MATVFRARDTVLDREVALKTIRTEASVAPDVRERYYKEARACARLQHRAIVVVYDLGEADQTAYVATELLTGSDLRRLIGRRAELPIAAKLAAMADVCEALGYAHRIGVLHRDLKPSNLFLLDDKRIKVLDFGVTRLFGPGPGVAGQLISTPNYMAPEEILGRPVDSRADLFSAAVICFEFLVHVHPFHGEFVPRRIVDGPPDSAFDYDAKLPALLEKVFARALAKDPAERYATGEELAEDLRAAIEAPPPSGGVQPRAAKSAPASAAAPPAAPPREPAPLPVAERAAVPRAAPAMRLTAEFVVPSTGNDGRAGSGELFEPAQPAEPAAPEAEAWQTLEPSAAAEPVNPQGAGEAPRRPAGASELCPNCNTVNRHGTVRCLECGERLLPDEAPQASPSGPPAGGGTMTFAESGSATTAAAPRRKPQEAASAAATQARYQAVSRQMTDSQSAIAIAEEPLAAEVILPEPAAEPAPESPVFEGPLFGERADAGTLAPHKPIFGKMLFRMRGGAAKAASARPAFERVLLGMRGASDRLAPPQPVIPQPAFVTRGANTQAADPLDYERPLFGTLGYGAAADADSRGKTLLAAGVGAALVAGALLLFAHPSRPAHSVSPAPAPVVAPAPAHAAAAASVKVPARLLLHRDPVYSANVRRLIARGEMYETNRALVEAAVGADGKVTGVKFVSGHPLLADAAREAVMQWRFKPALSDGQPVASSTRVPVNFAKAR